MALTLHHVGLSVSNLDRSLAFYGEVLGFTVVRIIDCPPEGKLGEVTGIPGACARLAHLALGDAIVELLEYQHPHGQAIPPEYTMADAGFSHICLASDDITTDYLRLKACGVRFYTEPIEYRPGVHMAYFYGPDGETCELRQVIS
jgi:catechol 2,3-dioxygenase-like lactoylglutathione lyase family enzyme